MTGRELLRRVTAQLAAAGCEDAAFDASCILADIGGCPHPDEGALADAAVAAVTAAARERADGRPLQYILGSWDFLTLTLEVGEGVLIPRPDTEILCEQAAAWLSAHGESGARVLDLCAGTGCVGLGVASLCRHPLAVEAVELYPPAARYLTRNIARYPQYAVTAVTADVLRDAARFEAGYAAILSNPPYIPTDDLPGLMREVQREPVTALDGDTDGLRFYRAIARDWTAKLRPGGLCAVEVGVGQAADVATLFEAAGLQNIQIVNDYAGVPRVVMGEQKA